MRVEVLSVSDTGRRRRWATSEKIRIVLESLEAGATATEVARRNEVSRSQIYDWRHRYRTMTEAANELGVTNHVIRRLIKDGILSAKRLVEGAPYQIHADDLLSESVQDVIKRKGRPCRAVPQNQISMFPNT